MQRKADFFSMSLVSFSTAFIIVGVRLPIHGYFSWMGSLFFLYFLLALNLHRPPRSSPLSKHVGTKPSSRPALMAVNPEGPAPIITTLQTMVELYKQGRKWLLMLFTVKVTTSEILLIGTWSVCHLIYYIITELIAGLCWLFITFQYSLKSEQYIWYLKI